MHCKNLTPTMDAKHISPEKEKKQVVETLAANASASSSSSSAVRSFLSTLLAPDNGDDPSCTLSSSGPISFNIVVDNARSSNNVHRQKMRMLNRRSNSLPMGACRWSNSSNSQHSSSSTSSNSSSGSANNGNGNDNKTPGNPQECPPAAPLPMPRRHSVTVTSRAPVRTPSRPKQPKQQRPAFKNNSNTISPAWDQYTATTAASDNDDRVLKSNRRRALPQQQQQHLLPPPPPTRSVEVQQDQEESELEDTDVYYSDSSCSNINNYYSRDAGANTAPTTSSSSTRNRRRQQQQQQQVNSSPSTNKMSDQDSLSMALINTIERLSVRAALTLSRPHVSASSRMETMEAIEEAMELCPKRGSVTDVSTTTTNHMNKHHHSTTTTSADCTMSAGAAAAMANASRHRGLPSYYSLGESSFSDFDDSERTTREDVMADQTQQAELNDAMIHAVDRLAVKAALTMTDQDDDAF